MGTAVAWQGRRAGAAALRAPLRPRAWCELAYVLVAVPLAVLGAGYVLLSLAVSAVLAITALGVPLLAAAVAGTRLLGRVRRWLVGVLLGVPVPAPEPLSVGPGLLGRVRAGLRDGPGWRAMAYQLAGLPVAIVALATATFTWAWGLVALTYPVQHALGVNQMTAPGPHGSTRSGLVLGGLVLDTWPGLLAASLAGAGLLLLAPWAVRGVLLLDLVLVRALLGRDDGGARIAQLRHSRARAVEDAAATLRRIERDLHDGVQARLVALTMDLTMISDSLGGDRDATRAMLAAARDSARDAVGELREVIRGIHPPVLDSGLGAAVETLAARCPVPVRVEVAVPERPGAAIETIAYFCVSELLGNVARHSGATAARVRVFQPGRRLRVVVSDDGHGGARIGAGAVPGAGGTGLAGLADRVGTVDGTLTVDSPPGGPTVVTVDLPPHL